MDIEGTDQDEFPAHRRTSRHNGRRRSVHHWRAASRPTAKAGPWAHPPDVEKSRMSANKKSSYKELPIPPPGTQERRSVCRYAVVQDSAWIGWWEGQAFQSTTAKIVDISLRGALLNVESFPPK